MRLLYLLLAAILLSSCVEMVEGEGDVITREYDLKEFHSVVLDMHGRVNISQGDQNISVTTNQNIYEWLNLYVSNGVLYIDLQDDVEVWRFDEMLFEISAPLLKRLELDGAGDIGVSKLDLSGEDFEIEIDGAGDIILNELLCKNLILDVDGVGTVKCKTLEAELVQAEIDGAGNIRLSGGIKVFDISIDGTGSVHGFDMPCDDALVDIDGAGNCHLNVNERLNVDIDGTGSVFYKGDPETNISTNGAGTVNKVD